MKTQLCVSIFFLALMSFFGTITMQDSPVLYARNALTGQVWGFPANISRTSGKSTNPVIAVDASGVLHVVWSDNTLDNWEVFYTYKPVDGFWHPPVDISNTPDFSEPPDLAIDGSGTLHVVWPDGGGYLHSSKRPGGLWSMPVVIFSSGGVWPRWISIAVDSTDTLHVVGSRVDRGITQGFYSTKTPDGAWSAPQNITKRPDHCDDFDIAIDRENAPHVVWFDWESHNILYSTLHSGFWSIPVQVSDSYMAMEPSIAIGNSSGLHVVWRDDYYAIYYASKPYGGAWSTPVALHEQMSHSMEFPDIAVDDARNRIWVVWGFEEYVDTPTTIYFTVRENGVRSPPMPLVDMHGEHPSVAIDKEGRAHVVWDDGNDIYYIGPGHRVYLPLVRRWNR